MQQQPQHQQIKRPSQLHTANKTPSTASDQITSRPFTGGCIDPEALVSSRLVIAAKSGQALPTSAAWR
jgi:hypothetical protein